MGTLLNRLRQVRDLLLEGDRATGTLGATALGSLQIAFCPVERHSTGENNTHVKRKNPRKRSVS